MTGPSDIARQYSAESALLILLLRQRLQGIKDEADTERFLGTHPVNPGILEKLLAAHSLASLVYPWLPEEYIGEKLSARVGFRAKANLAGLAEMTRLQELFEQSSIQVIFVKGVLLSKILFDDFTSRSAADIDILIRANDFAAIRDLLLRDGYEELYPFPVAYPDYYLRQNREAAFRKELEGGARQYVEIQWAPMPGFFPIPYNNDYFFEHRIQVQVGPKSIPTLATTQHLLMLFVHHGVGDLWRILRHVSDIAIFIHRKESEIDWEEIHRKASEWHMRRTISCGLALAAGLLYPGAGRYMNGTPDPALLDRCRNYLLGYPLLPKKKINRLNLQQQLRLSDFRRDRFVLIRGYFQRFLSPGMEELNLVTLPRALFPLYYLVRRFRFLYRSGPVQPS
ncbi:MAG: nucleotidyltransferase family protein [Chitinophagaceae bacterium]|jgi:hypothetical protein|nr:nucleotidyltransferase family protein [Chitinophagaceae bacterium]